jgi:hypothetical protein
MRRSRGWETLRRNMITVGTYRTRSDAELAQAALVVAGIQSVLEADDAGGAYPFDLSGGARLLVSDTDAAEALEILEDQGRTG